MPEPIYCPHCNESLSERDRHRGYCPGCDTDLPGVRFVVKRQLHRRTGKYRFAVLDTARNGLPYAYRSDVEGAYDEAEALNAQAEAEARQ